MNETKNLPKDKIATFLVGSALIISGPIFGAGYGALTGQILDWIPYLNNAIPEGMGYLENILHEGNYIKENLQGNIDKVGAVVGFLGYYFNSNSLKPFSKTSKES